jgi:histone H3/H4
MSKIPLAAMDRIIREIGAERVSEDAKEALREILEDEAKELIRRADRISKHAGRTTIVKEDIHLAK